MTRSLTCDPTLVEQFWLNDYAPLVLNTEARRYPALERIGEALGATMSIHSVPIPLDCTDGFNEAGAISRRDFGTSGTGVCGGCHRMTGRFACSSPARHRPPLIQRDGDRYALRIRPLRELRVRRVRQNLKTYRAVSGVTLIPNDGWGAQKTPA